MVKCRPKDPGDGCPQHLREGPWPRRVAGSEILVVSPKRRQPGVWAPGRRRSRESGGRNTGVLGKEGRRTRPPDAAGNQERAGWSLHSFPDGTSGSGACRLRLWPASEGSPCTRVPAPAGSEGRPACTHLCYLSLCPAAPAAEGPRWPRGWWLCSTVRATAAQHRTDPNWPPDGTQGMRGPPAFRGCACGQRGPQ